MKFKNGVFYRFLWLWKPSRRRKPMELWKKELLNLLREKDPVEKPEFKIDNVSDLRKAIIIVVVVAVVVVVVVVVVIIIIIIIMNLLGNNRNSEQENDRIYYETGTNAEEV